MKLLRSAFGHWKAAASDYLARSTGGGWARRAIADPRKTVWVPPAAIHFKLLGRTIVALRSPGAPPDNWDFDRRRLEDTAKYSSVIAHFRDGVPWEQTRIFKRYATRLARGEVIRNCRTIDDLKVAYGTDMDLLYESLRERGFLSHHERSRRRSDLPHVYIGRDGEIIFGSDGNHRLALAMLLGIEKIACNVKARHADWQELRERLATMAVGDRKESLPPSLADHPDLVDLLPSGNGTRVA